MTPSAVYVAIGGNIGDVEENLAKAVALIHQLPTTRVTDVSGLYRTAPVGGPEGQPDFFNGAIALTTGLEPDQLMAALIGIEHQLGRVREVQDGPRTVDLDIILWGDLVVDSAHTTIPHPRMESREFVLLPLSEVGGSARHPVSNLTVDEMLSAIEDISSPRPQRVDFDPISDK